MRRTIVAITMLIMTWSLLAIVRQLRSINRQMTLVSCLYQAERGMLCREARPNQESQTPVPPSGAVITRRTT